tara:strand:- start:310 stop:726 length:417 start_codon:yes stop_codon:yes gene_type:complete
MEAIITKPISDFKKAEAELDAEEEALSKVVLGNRKERRREREVRWKPQQGPSRKNGLVKTVSPHGSYTIVSRSLPRPKSLSSAATAAKTISLGNLAQFRSKENKRNFDMDELLEKYVHISPWVFNISEVGLCAIRYVY